MIWGTWYTSSSFNPDTSAFTQRLNFPINHNLQSHACIHIQFHLKKKKKTFKFFSQHLNLTYVQEEKIRMEGFADHESQL